jgi:hypothetical protein
VPVLVNPVVMKDTMADVKLGMEILVGPDELELNKKKQKAQAMVQTKSPGAKGNEDLGLHMKIDGMNISVAQKEKK